MLIDAYNLVDLIKDISVKFNLRDGDSIDKLIKKISNNQAYYTLTMSELDIMEPTAKSGFFIKNCEILFKKDLKLPKFFNKKFITHLKLLKNRKVRLRDIENKQVDVDFDDVKIRIKDMTIDLFLKTLQ